MERRPSQPPYRWGSPETHSAVPAPSSKATCLSAATLALVITGAAIWRTSGGDDAQVAKFGRQAPDSPLVMPEKGEPDMRLNPCSVWDSVLAPKALKFSPPMGTDQGALVYNAQKYWEMNDKRGGHHTGDDLNGIGGMNTDLGDPVFAAADGIVVYAGEPSPGWGNVVVLSHLAPDGKPMQSMYAHLDKIEVAKDTLVGRGVKIGTVGTANGYYPAHLHFEIRAGDTVDIGGGYANDPADRLDPSATVGKLSTPEANSAPSPLSKM